MAASTSSVLCLYAGGTLGMIKHEGSGYAPYPGFLTETLRTQARFHDVDGNSIFSWSDTTARFKQWSEAYSSHSQPPTRDPSPAPPRRDRDTQRSGGLPSAPSTPTSSSIATAGAVSSAFGPPFGGPVRVRSSNPDGTSTRNAVSAKTLPDGTLEMQLPTLITPKSSHSQRRVRYTVLEYDPLLDSSEMGLDDWTRMARDIELNYADFDAFVILHGTDTMSYTASALSFLLENLGKTVIVTGAQVPLSELRNDAIENVLGALMIASTYIIPEVCLFFASALYRGNRSSKVSNNALSAFDSPNLPPLARVGIGIDVNWPLVEPPRSVRSFRAHDSMCPDVALLRLFPGMPTDTIKQFLSSKIQGLCIESFGAGNAPSRPDLLEAFREATSRGVVIVNITQCLQGEVSAIYALGQKLAAVGVVAGADMTPECALTKLAYLLSKPDLTRDQVRELMGRSIRGELTTRAAAHGSSKAPTPVKARLDVADLLSRILHKPNDRIADVAGEDGDGDGEEQQTSEADKAIEREIGSAERIILPYLIHRAASVGDADALQWHLDALQRLESSSNHPSSTTPAVHITSAGDSAASAMRADGLDRRSESASASTGQQPTPAYATHHQSAPLDSSQALHIASALGHAKCVSVLLQAGSSVHLRDPLAGKTPLWLAASNGHVAVVDILRGAGAHLSQDEIEEVGQRFWKRSTPTENRGRDRDRDRDRGSKSASQSQEDVEGDAGEPATSDRELRCKMPLETGQSQQDRLDEMKAWTQAGVPLSE
ncbi:unnamed protein product [Parajaminaea phylloscopi]